MKTYKLKFSLLLAILIFSVNLHAQNNEKMFVSGEGFKIGLPEPTSPMKEISFDDGKLNGYGKIFYWDKPDEYFYQIFSYLINTENKTLKPTETNYLFETFKNELIKEPKERNFPFAEKDFIFNGNKGKQLTIIYPNGKTIARYFVVGKRFYLLNASFNKDQNEDEIVRNLDSFALLDSKSLIAAKLADATPQPLPQAPASQKAKTDVQDENLKGKVKSIIEYTQSGAKGKREREFEKYYDEKGNLIKEISYTEDYPSAVTVWGFIDKNRVSKTNEIYFDEDQRTPLGNPFITMSADGSLKNPDAPKDERYTIKHDYKYNDDGKLIEEFSYSNNGELWSRRVYNYEESRKEELYYGQNGDLWSRTYETLDEDGNVIESYSKIDGKIEDRNFYTYEFDEKGNWIVQKIFEKKKVKGKTVSEILWISYRTITYYP